MILGIIDKSVIENFAFFEDEDLKILSALSCAEHIMESALNELSLHNPYISNNFAIKPVGAFYSHTVIASSTLDLIMVVDNPQILLNTYSLFKNKWQIFKSKLKYAWQNRKKKKKKRRKKKKGSEEQNITFLDPKNDYNIQSLSKDLVKAISKHITTGDIVHLENGVIIVQGETIPYKIRVFPVLKKDDTTFQFFNQSKTKLIDFSLDEHHTNIESLLENFGPAFTQQAKIFGGLYHHLINQTPNPVFIESLLANLPITAFEDEDPYNNFVFSVNYLLNLKPNKLFSVANPSKKIHEDNFCGMSLLELTNFLKKLFNNL